MIRTDELDYELPQGMIATRPAEPRDSARMLVVWRSEPQRPIEHRLVRDLPEYLRAGDALVFNTTSVMPARFFGRRAGTGGRIEGLFLEELPASSGHPTWRVMLKAGGHLHPGDRIELVDHDQEPTGFAIELRERADAEWIVQLHGSDDTRAVLNRLGWTPLPPYILKARGEHPLNDDDDRRWYQTTYADAAKSGAVAAPTAGLHFTPELLARLRSQNVERIDVTLHVGPGTFKPVTAATLDEHPMHSEHYEVSASALSTLKAAIDRRHRDRRTRILAVGTTSVRTLESLTSESLKSHSSASMTGHTNLLIAPPYHFKCVDGMLTNFHLPRSTLLALVAAMIGLERVKAAYHEAIERGYRFYSYGDAMLILP